MVKCLFLSIMPHCKYMNSLDDELDKKLSMIFEFILLETFNLHKKLSLKKQNMSVISGSLFTKHFQS